MTLALRPSSGCAATPPSDLLSAGPGALLGTCAALLSSGISPAALIDDHLAPAMRTVGELWAAGIAGVADEHVFTAGVEHALELIPGGQQLRGKVAIASVEGEWHTLPSRMLTAALAAAGWRCLDLGPSTCSHDLAGSLARRRPDALLLSCSMTSNLGALAEAIQTARQLDIPVYAGGRALGSDGRRAEQVGADGWAPDTAGALGLLQAMPRRNAVDASEWTQRLLAYRGAAAQTARWLRMVDAGVANDDLAQLLQVVTVADLLTDRHLVIEQVEWRMSLGEPHAAGPVALRSGLGALLTIARSDARGGQLLAMLEVAATVLGSSGIDAVPPPRPDTVITPPTDPESPRAPRRSGVSRGAARPMRVLLLADHAPTKRVEVAFSRAGSQVEIHRVRSESDFVAGLGGRPDVILSDTDVPGIDAHLALTLRNEWAPDTPFLVVAEAVGSESAVRLIEEGVSDYVLYEQMERLPLAVSNAIGSSATTGLRSGYASALRRRRADILAARSADLQAVVNEARLITDVNNKLACLLGIPRADLLGEYLADFVHEDDRLAVADATTDCIATPRVGVPLRVRIRSGIDEWRTLDVVISNFLADIAVRGIVVNASDVTERVDAERRQAEEMALVSRIASDEEVAPLLADLARLVTDGEDGLTVMFVFDDPSFRWGRQPCPFTPTIELATVTVSGFGVGTMVVVGQSDKPARLDPTRRTAGLSLAALIAQREISKRLVAHRETHDQLTDLANRTLLTARIDRVLASPGRVPGLLVVGVDHFREVNDGIGIAAGDLLLRELATRLVALAGPGETVARLGGDEFALLVEDVDRNRHLAELGRAVLASMLRPVDIGPEAVHVTVSVGVANAGDAPTGDDLIAEADAALAAAKHAGRNRVVVFDRGQRDRLVRRHTFEAELRRAVATDELACYLQPVVDLQSGSVVGAEALVRWQHPVRGLLSPADFVPEAEERNLISLVDQWMLERVCQFLHDHPGRPGFSISVNANAGEISGDGFCATVGSVLARHALLPASLAIEVTESVALQSPAAARRNLAELRALGHSVYLDDFGTGYSSLGYLQQLPVDVLKIDRTFVDAMGGDRDALALVTAVTAMASALSLRCIAEGVETERQRDALRKLGVDRAQGYLYDRPMPADEFARRHLGG